VTAEPTATTTPSKKGNTRHDNTHTRQSRTGIVLIVRVGSERHALTATQVRDTVAAYLAKGGHMPTPRHGDGTDPYAPLHVITEEWLWGNVPGWAASADIVHLTTYRHHAMSWIRGYFGPSFPGLDH
jgi:hypothetical protein